MSAIPRCDFHIHTKYLGCADATMEVAAIVAECKRLGVTAIGITDHLNSPDKLPLHRPIRKDIESLAPALDIFFGVELNFTGLDQGFVFDPGIKEEYGFQFAIGGIHTAYLETYDLKKLVDIQHRHHLKTCADPLVDVLVHPYWFNKQWDFDNRNWPWFDSMSAVPERYARELGQAARETGTAIEINASANLVNPAYSRRFVEEYLAFLAIVAEEGACFSMGSDAHNINSLKNITAAWQAAERLNLAPERIWRPQGKPLKGAAGRKQPAASRTAAPAECRG